MTPADDPHQQAKQHEADAGRGSEQSSPAKSVAERTSLWTQMRTLEDWWAIWCAGLLLAISFAVVWASKPADLDEQIAAGQQVKVSNPIKSWLAKPGAWTANPAESIYQVNEAGEIVKTSLPGMMVVFLTVAILFTGAIHLRGKSGWAFLEGFPVIFLLATIAYMMSEQELVSRWNLEYALWALMLGLIISNTVGTPAFLRPAMLTEFYIKTGLVLLGAEILFNRLLALGAPGVFVAWVVTPIVLISTYVFGQKVLKMESKSLNMVISADMSVCGVSAAIATAAACKAKKEELSLAIGMSLTFTVVMMVVMPILINLIGMDEVLAGAWLGGTIDSTGAVALAGEAVGERAMEVAATIKMIQNILIGATAFCVAVYWVSYVERDQTAAKPSFMEIWRRFPKFVLGFVLFSVLFSLAQASLVAGPEIVDSVIGGTKVFRGWFFCLAFVSIGLETNFRELAPYLRSGKPLVLYVCGQLLNIVLTLAMAYLMFSVIYREKIAELFP